MELKGPFELTLKPNAGYWNFLEKKGQVKYSFIRLLRFGRIGKHPKVHYAAKDVFNGKVKPDEIIPYETFLRLLKKPMDA